MPSYYFIFKFEWINNIGISKINNNTIAPVLSKLVHLCNNDINLLKSLNSYCYILASSTLAS